MFERFVPLKVGSGGGVHSSRRLWGCFRMAALDLSVITAPPNGQFTDVTLSVRAADVPATALGQTIGIRLGDVVGTGFQQT